MSLAGGIVPINRLPARLIGKSDSARVQIWLFQWHRADLPPLTIAAFAAFPQEVELIQHAVDQGRRFGPDAIPSGTPLAISYRICAVKIGFAVKRGLGGLMSSLVENWAHAAATDRHGDRPSSRRLTCSFLQPVFGREAADPVRTRVRGVAESAECLPSSLVPRPPGPA